jgi:tripartite-type tricarboxylate transporter receptor subunit TctC
VTSAQRSPGAPEVPAIAETVPGYDASTWYGVVAPARLPGTVAQRLNAELQAILATHPEAKPQLKAQKTDAKTTKTKSAPKDRAAAFKKRDTNQDNKLTLEEFLINQPDPEAAPKRFPTFDANKDGTLSPEEYIHSGKPKP